MNIGRAKKEVKAVSILERIIAGELEDPRPEIVKKVEKDLGFSLSV